MCAAQIEGKPVPFVSADDEFFEIIEYVAFLGQEPPQRACICIFIGSFTQMAEALQRLYTRRAAFVPTLQDTTHERRKTVPSFALKIWFFRVTGR